MVKKRSLKKKPKRQQKLSRNIRGGKMVVNPVTGELEDDGTGPDVYNPAENVMGSVMGESELDPELKIDLKELSDSLFSEMQEKKVTQEFVKEKIDAFLTKHFKSIGKDTFQQVSGMIYMLCSGTMQLQKFEPSIKINCKYYGCETEILLEGYSTFESFVNVHGKMTMNRQIMDMRRKTYNIEVFTDNNKIPPNSNTNQDIQLREVLYDSLSENENLARFDWKNLDFKIISSPPEPSVESMDSPISSQDKAVYAADIYLSQISDKLDMVDINNCFGSDKQQYQDIVDDLEGEQVEGIEFPQFSLDQPIENFKKKIYDAAVVAATEMFGAKIRFAGLKGGMKVERDPSPLPPPPARKPPTVKKAAPLAAASLALLSTGVGAAAASNSTSASSQFDVPSGWPMPSTAVRFYNKEPVSPFAIAAKATGFRKPFDDFTGAIAGLLPSSLSDYVLPEYKDVAPQKPQSSKASSGFGKVFAETTLGFYQAHKVDAVETKSFLNALKEKYPRNSYATVVTVLAGNLDPKFNVVRVGNNTYLEVNSGEVDKAFQLVGEGLKSIQTDTISIYKSNAKRGAELLIPVMKTDKAFQNHVVAELKEQTGFFGSLSISIKGLFTNVAENVAFDEKQSTALANELFQKTVNAYTAGIPQENEEYALSLKKTIRAISDPMIRKDFEKAVAECVLTQRRQDVLDTYLSLFSRIEIASIARRIQFEKEPTMSVWNEQTEEINDSIEGFFNGILPALTSANFDNSRSALNVLSETAQEALDERLNELSRQIQHISQMTALAESARKLGEADATAFWAPRFYFLLYGGGTLLTACIFFHIVTSYVYLYTTIMSFQNIGANTLLSLSRTFSSIIIYFSRKATIENNVRPPPVPPLAPPLAPALAPALALDPAAARVARVAAERQQEEERQRLAAEEVARVAAEAAQRQQEEERVARVAAAEAERVERERLQREDAARVAAEAAERLQREEVARVAAAEAERVERERLQREEAAARQQEEERQRLADEAERVARVEAERVAAEAAAAAPPPPPPPTPDELETQMRIAAYKPPSVKDMDDYDWENAKKNLIEFYTAYDPTKLENVELILSNKHGSYKLLFNTLYSKYGTYLGRKIPGFIFIPDPSSRGGSHRRLFSRKIRTTKGAKKIKKKRTRKHMKHKNRRTNKRRKRN